MTGGHSQDPSPRIDPANLLCLTWLTDCHARPKSLIKIMSGVKRWTSPVFRPYPLTELAPWLPGSLQRGEILREAQRRSPEGK